MVKAAREPLILLGSGAEVKRYLLRIAARMLVLDQGPIVRVPTPGELARSERPRARA